MKAQSFSGNTATASTSINISGNARQGTGINVAAGWCVPNSRRCSSCMIRSFCMSWSTIITRIFATLDTHEAMQIFHPLFWVNQNGEHPEPYTQISAEDVEQGRWRVNPAVAHDVADGNLAWLEQYARHYVRTLEASGKYQLTIWPYHTMLGSLGHALVSSVAEAVFFHSVARVSKPEFEIKGGHPLTENYSVIRPEVLAAHDRTRIAQTNTRFIDMVLRYDLVAIIGQAASHCVAWTIEDLLTIIGERAPGLADKVYILEDCTSPVVVPGVVDYSMEADIAFRRFADMGAHILNSTQPLESWPSINV
ncbi:MAG: isochorismatase [Nitrososphaerota archaeon]